MTEVILIILGGIAVCVVAFYYLVRFFAGRAKGDNYVDGSYEPEFKPIPPPGPVPDEELPARTDLSDEQLLAELARFEYGVEREFSAPLSVAQWKEIQRRLSIYGCFRPPQTKPKPKNKKEPK